MLIVIRALAFSKCDLFFTFDVYYRDELIVRSVRYYVKFTRLKIQSGKCSLEPGVF